VRDEPELWQVHVLQILTRIGIKHGVVLFFRPSFGPDPTQHGKNNKYNQVNDESGVRY
jgi:hypothetical protein